MKKKGMTGIQILIAFVIGALVLYVGYVMIFKGQEGIKSTIPLMTESKVQSCEQAVKMNYQLRGKLDLLKTHDLDGDGISIFCDPCECPPDKGNCKNDPDNDKDKDGYYSKCDLKDDDSKSGPIELCKEKYKKYSRCCFGSDKCDKLVNPQ